MNKTYQYNNKLAHEKSPYLLQHAHNPVNWQTWGEDAFNTAVAEEKPVLLSIGYSTCHWCHVMADESFSDPLSALNWTAKSVLTWIRFTSRRYRP